MGIPKYSGNPESTDDTRVCHVPNNQLFGLVLYILSFITKLCLCHLAICHRNRSKRANPKHVHTGKQKKRVVFRVRARQQCVRPVRVLE